MVQLAVREASVVLGLAGIDVEMAVGGVGGRQCSAVCAPMPPLFTDEMPLTLSFEPEMPCSCAAVFHTRYSNMVGAKPSG